MASRRCHLFWSVTWIITFGGIANRSSLGDSETVVSSSSATPTSSTASPVSYLSFVTANFTECFSSAASGYLTSLYFYNASASEGLFAFDGRQSVPFNRRRCDVLLVAPKGTLLLFHLVRASLPCGTTSFTVYESSNAFANLRYTFCGLNDTSAFPRVYILSNKAVASFSLFSFSRDVRFQANFTAVLPSSYPRLGVTFESENKGSVTSPEWDGLVLYPPNLHINVSISVPANHSVMLSFAHLNMPTAPSYSTCLDTDYVRVTADVRLRPNLTPEAASTAPAGAAKATQVLYEACGRALPPAQILHHADVLRVLFHSNDVVETTGFQLQFSFHSPPDVPEQVLLLHGGVGISRGGWNCSGSHWPQFRHHFPCNLLPDCLGGEDEVDCPYASALCGPGRFRYGGSCYAFFRARGRNSSWSWEEAAALCRQSGAHLVSLNEAGEWAFVTSLLRQYGSTAFFTGLFLKPRLLPMMYGQSLQWADGNVAYLYHVKNLQLTLPACASADMSLDVDYVRGTLQELESLSLESCYGVRKETDVVCEERLDHGNTSTELLPFSRPGPFQPEWPHGYLYVACPARHFTHRFLACDLPSACFAPDVSLSRACAPPLTPPPPMFTCANQFERMPYTLVCDHRPDCSDHSDESFCQFPPCRPELFDCGSGQSLCVQCVPGKQRCDGVAQCFNAVDEQVCPDEPLTSFASYIHTPLPPGLVTFRFQGGCVISPLNVTSPGPSPACPATHFLCPGVAFYCLPVYVRCNGVYDCPEREDEAACDSSVLCPGLYRCRAASVCLHPAHLCDGVFQCPQQDDELFCNRTCPDVCTCYGHAFFCHSPFAVHEHPTLRFLDGRESGLTTEHVAQSFLLVHLSLASCKLTSFSISLLYNLRSLDLSDNFLTSIPTQAFAMLPRLTSLNLAGNPISTGQLSGNLVLKSLLILDLSRVRQQTFNESSLSVFPMLETLNLSSSGVDEVVASGFQSLIKLRSLDLRGCPLTQFPHDLLQGLQDLQYVYADNYKLCCPLMLPEGFNINYCLAPSDEISSCDALLQSDLYRVMLALFASLALLGNAASFLYRVISRVSGDSGFAVFVTHLSVADLLMGVYLAVIGVADRLYLGTYLWKDVQWKSSVMCQAAGFLSFLSREVSSFIIFLITLDRFLVLRFPFSQWHFHPRSAHLACVLLWAAGLGLAALPLLPATVHWRYYSQTGICIPLPISRKTFAGQRYSFGVMVVLNFGLSLLIASGQLVIYWSIRTNSLSSAETSRKSRDLTIARRLLTIALSDFLCWFPIGLLGLLASHGVAVPGQLSVALAILVLPLNSALNPFLYTINVILEKRRQVKEARLVQRLKLQTNYGGGKSQSSVVSLVSTHNSRREDVKKAVTAWLSDGVLNSKDLELMSKK